VLLFIAFLVPRFLTGNSLPAGRQLIISWWTRVWVFQEFVLSKKACFLCDSSNIDCRRLNGVLGYLLVEKHGHLRNRDYLLSLDEQYPLGGLADRRICEAERSMKLLEHE
jgi:hypothetical protein